MLYYGFLPVQYVLPLLLSHVSDLHHGLKDLLSFSVSFNFLEVCPYVCCTINLVLVSPSKTDTCILLSHFSSVWLFVILWTGVHQTALSMGFTRQEYWSWCHAFLQGIFPTQWLNLCLLCLLYWQVGSLQLKPRGKPPKWTQCKIQITFKIITFIQKLDEWSKTW